MNRAVAVFAAVALLVSGRNKASVRTVPIHLVLQVGGSIDGTATVEFWNQKTTVSVRIVNNSGAQLRTVCICIRSAGDPRCPFTFWNTAILAKGESFTGALTEPEKLTAPLASLEKIELDRFSDMRTIFVAPIDGNAGAMAREKIIAAVVNSRRFAVVEKETQADAVIKGRADTVGQANVQTITNAQRTGQLAAPGAEAGIAFTKAQTESNQAVTRDSLAIRLTNRATGETVWAWDDSQMRCQPSAEAQCAIHDLLIQALPPLGNPAIR